MPVRGRRRRQQGMGRQLPEAPAGHAPPALEAAARHAPVGPGAPGQHLASAGAGWALTGRQLPAAPARREQPASAGAGWARCARVASGNRRGQPSDEYRPQGSQASQACQNGPLPCREHLMFFVSLRGLGRKSCTCLCYLCLGGVGGI